MLLAILLRGSPSIFFVSFFLTFNLRHVPILHSNYTQIAPKWWVSILLQKSIFKMWPTFFVCGESPCVLIFFFRKFVYRKSISSLISSYFLTGTYCKWKINWFRTFRFLTFVLQKKSEFFRKQILKIEEGETEQSASLLMCKIDLSFICKWSRQKILREGIDFP